MWRIDEVFFCGEEVKTSFMKHLLLFLLIPILISSCYTAGITTLSTKKFIPLKNWNDTVVFIKAFDQFKLENKNLCLDSIVIRKVVDSFNNSKIKDSSIYNPDNWYPIVDKPFSHNLYSWYVVTKDRNFIYELGLSYSGISIWSVKKLEKGYYITYSPYDIKLPDKKFIKQIEKNFETEILPLLKPYFKEYMKK